MADLDVQPRKRSSPWWLWLLLVLLAILIIFFLMRGCNKQTTTTDPATGTAATGTAAVAATQPDWNSVDFNAPASKYPEVGDPAISVHGNDKYTIYTLGENILFATDQANLHSSAGQKLQQVAASLSQRFKGAAIGIYGNTDSTGTEGHNRQLGAQRAQSVKEWLVKNGGIPEGMVTIHSLGDTKPVATNATGAGRQQNRNVEIVAFPNSAAH